ncbi:MAG: lipoyl domain-containing protein [Gemmataceae bacterium]
MAAVEIKVTPAGESITHATLVRRLKPDGSAVKAGEAVCELETDKATKEEYAPANGVLSTRAPARRGWRSARSSAASIPPARPRPRRAPRPWGQLRPAAAAPGDVRLSPAARPGRYQGPRRQQDPAVAARRRDQGRGPRLRRRQARAASRPNAGPAPAPEGGGEARLRDGGVSR